jgi:PKD repeat protein
MKKILLTLLIASTFFSSFGQKVFLSENFSTGSDTVPPTGWTQSILYSTDPTNDQWNFNNPANRTPDTSSTTDFDKDFAVNDRSRNGLNALANVALVSPKFSTQGYNDVQLTFDHATLSGTAMTCFVEVTNGNGVWTIVRQFGNANLMPENVRINISNTAKNTCEAQVRFRFVSNINGVWMLDNVKVFANDTVPRVNDIRLVDFNPPSGVCGSQNAEIKLVLRNDGTANLSNIPLYIQISDGSTTQTFRDTLASISTCRDTIFTFNQTANISNANATYTIFAYSSLSNDELRASDTTVIGGYKVSPAPSDPSDKFKKLCGFQSNIRDTVSLGTDEEASWFSSQNGSNSIGQGQFFNLTNIKNDTSIFVEKFIAASKIFPQNIGIQPTLRYTIGGTTGSLSGMFIDFVAKENIILSELEIVTSFTGTFEYDVYTKNGSYRGFENNASAWTVAYSDDTTIGTAQVVTRIPIGDISLKAGDSIGLYLFNKTALSMHFSSGPVIGENDELAYHSGYVNPATAFAQGLQNFGYGSRVHYKKVCASYRAKYEYEVTPLLTGANIDTLPGFKGIHRGISSSSSPDAVYIGETFDYELKPPTGYTYADLGTKWTISNFLISYLSGASIPSGDTTTTRPSTTQAARLRLTPGSSSQNRTMLVEVTITDLDRLCDTVVLRYIKISKLPEFDLDIINPCANSEMRIINRSALPEELLYVWNFGDNSFSTEKFPRKKYTSPGNYTVKYEINTLEGLSVDTTFNVTITETPVADFKVSNACFGQAVKFENTSTVSSGNMSFAWDFDAEGTSSQKDPSFNFSSDGLFDVQLKATLNGCTDSITKTARQFELPKPDFNTTGGCHNADITFLNTSSLKSGESVGAYWDFGDGLLKTGNTSIYNFNSIGTKNVKIIAESGFKCKDSITKPVALIEAPIAEFSFDQLCDKTPTTFENKTSQPTGVGINYQWNFGDGKLSNDENPVHQFTNASNYVVGLTAIGSNGCRSSKSQTLTVKVQPLAAFSVTDGCTNKELDFFNNSTSNVPGSTYSWNFDDGNTSDVFSPKHIFANAGNYKVTLTASREECKSILEKEITIKESPVCGFRFEQSKENLREFKFIPNVETYKEYRWRFDNTGTSNQVSPTHIFPIANRNYAVRLDVTSENGCDCRQDDVNVFSGVNSIHNIAKGTFKVYPNPTVGNITIEVQNYDLKNTLEISVIDGKGQVVKHLSNVLPLDDLINLNLEGLSAGIYVIHITSGNGIFTERISVLK